MRFLIVDCHTPLCFVRNDTARKLKICKLIDCHENFSNFLAMTKN
ncbi:hypothetical protein [Helicobacter rodentium]|nr:hypothetical protein [Helicobacter rodentium]